MKFKIIVCFCLLWSMKISAQKEFSDFEIKLFDFQYNLYDDLEKADVMEMQSLELMQKGKPIREKIDAFLNENRKEISKYQNVVLKKYDAFNIDTSGFQRDTLFYEFVEMYNESAMEINERIGEFYKINPLVYINTIKSIIVSRKYSASEVGRMSLINTIAHPKIATKQTGKNEYLIFLDEFYMAYLFKLDVTELKYEILGIFDRKP